MITILFWNLRRRHKSENEASFTRRQNNLVEAIERITRTYSVDVLLFAEFHLNGPGLVSRLQKLELGSYHYIPNYFLLEPTVNGVDNSDKIVERKIEIFSRFRQDRLSDVDVNSLNVKDKRHGENDGAETPLRYAVVGNETLSAALFQNDRFEHSRLTLRRLPASQGTELLLAAVHLVPKSYYNSVSQREEARRIAQRIRFAEQHIVGHARTIIVGDFNMGQQKKA